MTDNQIGAQPWLFIPVLGGSTKGLGPMLGPWCG